MADVRESQPKVDKQGDVNDLFGDPTVARTIDEDPILRFVVKNWQRFLTGLLLLGAVIYGRYRFEAAYHSRMSEASQLFQKVAEDYEQFHSNQAQLKTLQTDLAKGGEQAKLDELRKNLDKVQAGSNEIETRLKESISALADARPPYGQVSSIYQALLSKEQGGPATAKSALADAEQWREQAAANSPERLIWEVKALLLGRLLLDEASENAKGWELLKGLASSGSYLRVPAALTLARASDTPEERNEASGLLKALALEYPEESKLLEEEISRIS